MARQHNAVNAICPGHIETEINAHWFAPEGGHKQISTLPRQRLMDITALDETLLMLAGPAAGQITGTAITIDDRQVLQRTPGQRPIRTLSSNRWLIRLP